jgi:hypothetical protein
MHSKAMSPEEANRRLFFLSIAGANDSTIPLGSSPGSRQVFAQNKMEKSISPEGSSDDINTSQLHKKMDYAPFHELFQSSLQVFGEAYHHRDAENPIASILRKHIAAEKEALSEKSDDQKVDLQKIALEIKATKLALYMYELLSIDEREQ